ncbi:MAG TPA: sulfite oxidase [Gemmatimonadaceae bacterium]|jgi:DMSO/TMAO reductase YedYZ molybdopterin-dependent catalytic subunit
MSEAQHPASVEMIVRQTNPVNEETPLNEVDSYLTPSDHFYIRSHFDAPRIDRSAYRLHIDGAVANPLSLTYQELKAMPAETHVATMECAGNGRALLVPRVRGVQWELGAVGNAEWTGVPLTILLDRIGLKDDACEVVLEGADRGRPNEPPVPPEPIAFARSISRAKALHGDVLIAYAMNGKELPLHHGFPVRAVVPGHYGMASVKWLTHIEAVRTPFRGYWQTTDYAYWARVDGNSVRRALGEMELKSQIIRPRAMETIEPNARCTIVGMAWAGETEVTEICVSTDGGQSWSGAMFLDPARRYAWRRWTFEWMTPRTPGHYSLLSRAVAADGSLQPDTRDPSYGSYVINHLLPVEVIVAAD